MEEINALNVEEQVPDTEYIPTEEEQLAAARLMSKRRERSRAAYAANKEKYREKNRERRAKKREGKAPAPAKVLDLSEEGIALRKSIDEARRQKNREYAREKYKRDPESSAKRQRQYRLKRRVSYAAYLKNEKLKHSDN